jgi:hypothetical protein
MNGSPARERMPLRLSCKEYREKYAQWAKIRTDLFHCYENPLIAAIEVKLNLEESNAF